MSSTAVLPADKADCRDPDPAVHLSWSSDRGRSEDFI